MPVFFEILSEAFRRHGLVLPRDIYFFHILPLLERSLRSITDTHSHIRMWIRYSLGEHLESMRTYHGPASVPRIMEGRAKGWPIGRAWRPHYSLHSLLMNRIRRWYYILGDRLIPSTIRLLHKHSPQRIRLLEELRKAFVGVPFPHVVGVTSPHVVLWRLMTHRICSRVFLERAQDLGWPLRHAKRRHHFNEHEYQVLGVIRGYRRMGILQPSFIRQWERRKKPWRLIKKQITANPITFHLSHHHARLS